MWTASARKCWMCRWQNVFETLRIYLGSAYVNDFNAFGRTYRVTAQADAPYRLDQATISQLKVRSANGAMVPLGSLATFRDIAGPQRMPRYNLYPAIEMQGTTAPGVSSGQGIKIMGDARRAHSAGGRQLRMDGPVLSGDAPGHARHHHLRPGGSVRVSRAGRAV